MNIKALIISMLIILSVSVNCYSQGYENLIDINKQVWSPFTTAYETLDVELFKSIHSDDLIRVGGDSKSIKSFENYIDGYKTRWEDSRRKQTISFRFLERITGEKHASERGIYKLTLNPDTDEEKSYYGKFHVLLIKETSNWKILVDYDSSENNTIDEKSFTAAFAIDDFKKY